LSRKFKFHQNLTRITGTLHEDLCKFMIISGSILRRIRNILDESCRKNQNRFYVQYLFSKNRAVYDRKWKRMVESEGATDINTKRRIRTAWLIITATDTHLEYATGLLIAFHAYNGYANAPQCCVYKYVACFVLLIKQIGF
jgi:hypothetical protein